MAVSISAIVLMPLSLPQSGVGFKPVRAWRLANPYPRCLTAAPQFTLVPVRAASVFAANPHSAFRTPHSPPFTTPQPARSLAGGMQSAEWPQPDAFRRPSAYFLVPSAFVLGRLPGVLTVMSRRHYGCTTVWFPCGCGNLLCLQAFHGLLCIMDSCFRFPGAFLPYPVLLPGEPAPLAQPWAAPPLRASGDAGVQLFFGQGCAVFPGGGRQPRSPVPLRRGPQVSRFDPKAAALFVAWQHVPHPVAAAATLDGRFKALP
jgi:hypothetical protein